VKSGVSSWIASSFSALTIFKSVGDELAVVLVAAEPANDIGLESNS